MTLPLPPAAQVPTGVAMLTPEWLTEALRENGHIARDVTVIALDVAQVGAGRGYVCDTRRLTPRYNCIDLAAPASFVAKAPSGVLVPDEYRANWLEIQAAEVYWYREMASACPIPTPRCYWCGHTDGSAAVLLEDMSSLRTTDQMTGATREEADLAVQSLARIHAHWWADTGLLQKLWLRGPEHTGAVWQTQFAPGWRVAQRLLPGKLPKEFGPIGDLLCEGLGQVALDAAASAWTMAHGDYRVENFLFGDPHSPGAFYLLDWQLVSRGSGLVDLAYFIGQSLQPDVRRLHEKDLLELYFDTLCEAGVRDYDRAQCGIDYRRGLLISTWVAFAGFGGLDQIIAAGPGAVAEDERQAWQQYVDASLHLLEMMATRSTLAVVEAEAGRELSGA